MADLKRIFSRIADRQDAADIDAEANRIARQLDRATGTDRELINAEVRRLRIEADRLRNNR